MAKKEIIVVGGGIGGLTAGAMLAQEGCKVTILEASREWGGCAGKFQRNKFLFASGATLGMGLEKGGIHERIGFVYDDNVFYEHLTLKEMKRIIRSAYKRWDDKVFNHYIQEFELPLNQRLKTFSKGMKMKTSLAFALSHHAELIIMDEPTSGLDPIFRRELLKILHEIMQDGNKTIFFSTHITVDLDRIADYITFIHDGEHVFTKEYYKVEEEYAIVKGTLDLLDDETEEPFIAIRKTNSGFVALTDQISQAREIFGETVIFETPTLEDIMYYTKKGRSAYV